jgi:hypothetical protein
MSVKREKLLYAKDAKNCGALQLPFFASFALFA